MEFENLIDLSNLSSDSSAVDKEFAQSILRMYTTVVASEFADVNLVLYEQALRLDDPIFISEEDRKIARAAYLYASSQKGALRSLSQSKFQDQFNEAFVLYLVAKLESHVDSYLTAMKLMRELVEDDATIGKGIQYGMVNLYLTDLSRRLYESSNSDEYREDAIRFVANAHQAFGVKEFAPFFGLAYIYEAELLRAIHGDNQSLFYKYEIDRAYEVGRMFR